MNMKRIRYGFALGVMISLSATTGAMATPTSYAPSTPFDFGVNARTRGIYSENSSNWRLRDDNPSSTWLAAHPQAVSNNSNLWDGRASLYVDDGTSSYDAYINSSDGGSTFGDCLQDVNGSDITIECADQVVNGLTLHPEVYYYADHNLTRVIWVITNAGPAQIATNVQLVDSSQCGGNGNVEASNGDLGNGVTGDGAFTLTSWNWMVQSPMNSSPDSCAIEGSVWQAPGSVVSASDVDMDGNFDNSYITFPVSIPAGETIALASFYVDGWIDDNNQALNIADPSNPYMVSRAAVIQATKDLISSDLTSWTTLASRGVTPDLKVVNFTPASGGDSGSGPALANTGTDLTGMAGIALALLVIGGLTLVVVRRRLRAAM